MCTYAARLSMGMYLRLRNDVLWLSAWGMWRDQKIVWREEKGTWKEKKKKSYSLLYCGFCIILNSKTHLRTEAINRIYEGLSYRWSRNPYRWIIITGYANFEEGVVHSHSGNISVATRHLYVRVWSKEPGPDILRPGPEDRQRFEGPWVPVSDARHVPRTVGWSENRYCTWRCLRYRHGVPEFICF